jgi:hypothetical protein
LGGQLESFGGRIRTNYWLQLGQMLGQRTKWHAKVNRLTSRFLSTLLERANRGELRPDDYGYHADGRNAYAAVKKNGALSWSFI